MVHERRSKNLELDKTLDVCDVCRAGLCSSCPHWLHMRQKEDREEQRNINSWTYICNLLFPILLISVATLIFYTNPAKLKITIVTPTEQLHWTSWLVLLRDSSWGSIKLLSVPYCCCIVPIWFNFTRFCNYCLSGLCILLNCTGEY